MLQGMVYISDTKGGVRALDMKDGKRPGVAAGMCIIDRTPNDLPEMDEIFKAFLSDTGPSTPKFNNDNNVYRHPKN